MFETVLRCKGLHGGSMTPSSSPLRSVKRCNTALLQSPNHVVLRERWTVQAAELELAVAERTQQSMSAETTLKLKEMEFERRVTALEREHAAKIGSVLQHMSTLQQPGRAVVNRQEEEEEEETEAQPAHQSRRLPVVRFANSATHKMQPGVPSVARHTASEPYQPGYTAGNLLTWLKDGWCSCAQAICFPECRSLTCCAVKQVHLQIALLWFGAK